jgi:hypothetical protein
MKRIWTAVGITLIAIFMASPGFAQNLSAGAKVGVVFADLGGDFEEIIEASTDLKTGFSVSGFFGADLSRQFRLQAEVQYVQKGAKATVGGIEGKFNVNYLEILVPATFLIPVDGGTVVPRVYAGPSKRSS